jgi:phage anti-repressor protein
MKRASLKCPDPNKHFHSFQEKTNIRATKSRKNCKLDVIAAEQTLAEARQTKECKIALAFFIELREARNRARSCEIKMEKKSPIVSKNDADSHKEEEEKQLVDRWINQGHQGTTFPVDLDLGWPIAGYASKRAAKDRITGENSLYIEGEDYIIDTEFLSGRTKTPQGGRPSEKIYLTTDTFKELCLMAATQKGRRIRLYFIKPDKQLKQIEKSKSQLLSNNNAQQEDRELEKLKLRYAIAREKRLTTDRPPTENQIESRIKAIEERIATVESGAQEETSNTKESEIDRAKKMCIKQNLLTTGGNPDLNKYQSTCRLYTSA